MYYEEGQYSQAQINDAPMPWWADALEDMPGIPTVAAVNASRFSSTMIHGARGGGKSMGQIRGMFSQNLNPLNLFRFSTDEFIKNPDPKSKAYTPYGMARVGNAMLTMANKTPFLEEGALGRITAASRVQNMSANKFAKLSQTREFQNTVLGAPKPNYGAPGPGQIGPSMNPHARPAGYSKAPIMPQGPIPKSMSQNAAANALLMRGGRVSGFVGASSHYSQATKSGMIVKSLKAPSNATAAARKGVEAASKLAKAAHGGSTLAKGALMGTHALSRVGAYANPIGYMVLAYDIAKLTTKGIGYAAKLGGDYHKSKYSGMNTRIGGNGFADTEASLTSRSRGVQAIQNSRLNARSILGSEAGSMATYFG